MTDHERILELVTAEVDFEMTAAERGKVRAHLAECAVCREAAASIRTDAGRLATMPGLRAPDAVRDRIAAAALDERGAAPFSRPQMVLAVALLTVMLVGATVAIGAQVVHWLEQTRLPAPVVTPSASPSSGASSGPSSSASPAAPTPLPSPQLAYVLPDGAYPPTAWLKVTNGPLALYAWPWIDSGSSGQVESGGRAQVLGAPVVVDGRTWVSLHGGYAPIESLTNRVEIEPVDCPAKVDLAAVVAMSDWERLSCLGGQELILEGAEIIGFAEVAAAGQPTWLSGRGELVITPGYGYRSLAVHVAPGSVDVIRAGFDTELAPYGVRAVGHFNDPAATGCKGQQASLGDEGSQRVADTDPTGAEIRCRQQFVLTRLETLGSLPPLLPAGESGTPLLRVDIASDVQGPWPGMVAVVFPDGRLVTPSGVGWQERQLTDAARDAFIASVRGEPLLQANANYPPDPNYAAGFLSAVIRVERDGAVVRVSATNASKGATAAAVMALAESLGERVRALPASSFVEAAHLWMPSAYNLQVSLSPGVLSTYPKQPDFPMWVDDAVLPLKTPLVETGPVIRSEAGTTVRCSVIDLATASRLRAAFQAGGYPRSEDSFVLAGYSLGWRATNGIVEVTITAVPPDEPDTYHCGVAAGS